MNRAAADVERSALIANGGNQPEEVVLRILAGVVSGMAMYAGKSSFSDPKA